MTNIYSSYTDNVEVCAASKASNFFNLRYVVIDVDGSLTDGSIYYDQFDNELKKFSSKDAAGFFACKVTGITPIILTGRESPMTTKRLSELGVTNIYEGVSDKPTFLLNFIAKHNLSSSELAYFGDDYNDFQAMKMCGTVGCPADSRLEIQSIATYISSLRGGYGAFTDFVQFLLTDRCQWESAIKNIYKIS
ncbi:MAG: hypothetical protein CMM87_03300 [Rickettsiales bacterium]|nr:hypothetical protein [Rickettsiales bacterium]